MWKAVYRLAEHIRKRSILSRLVLFGADVSLFKGALFPKDYCLIQRDILNMLSHVGLNAGTGMESEHGDFGQFKDKLDENWHILGVHRDRTEAYLEAVLSAASSCETSRPPRVVDMAPAASGGNPPVMASQGFSVTPETSSSLSLIGVANLAAGERRLSNVRQTLIADAAKEYWVACGRREGYMWPRCSEQTSSRVVLCPVDAEEGTVLVCTSGDGHTETSGAPHVPDDALARMEAPCH